MAPPGPTTPATPRRTAILRGVLVTLSVVATVVIAGSLRQLELGRTALERSRIALGLGDYRTSIEEAELATSSYVPGGRYHELGFARLLAIADDALGRADDETAELALRSAKNALRASPRAGTGKSGGDAMGEIALRTGKLHTKSADLPATLAKTTPIVVAETPPPLAAYAFLGLAGIVYLAGVAASLRRPGSKSLPLAGLAVSIGALFFGIALYVL